MLELVLNVAIHMKVDKSSWPNQTYPGTPWEAIYEIARVLTDR